MKRVRFSLVFALILSALISAVVFGQQPKFKTEAEQKAYEKYYNAVYVEKDAAKGYELAKVFLEQYPDSEVAKYCLGTIINKVGGDFQSALTAFYGDGIPQPAKLDRLVMVGEDYLKLQPNQPYVSSHIALASSRAVLAQQVKDMSRAKMLAEKALSLMASPNPPADYPADQYIPLRENVHAQLNQFLGYYELEQPNPNLASAIAFLTKSTEVRNKDGLGWKDPNNYWLRASAYQKQYAKLSGDYRALPDDQKTGDAGKALLDQINPVIDKMIDDYARVVASATGNEAAKELSASAREQLDALWKYRYSNLANGQNELIRHFAADPTVAATARTPAAASPDMSAGAPPTTTSSKPTLTAAPAAGTASSTKAAPSTAKPKPKTTTTKKSTKKKH
jgi:hypothetical protein